MAPTLPSLLWGWVNAKHAGGVPNCIRLARPLLLDCGPASGKSARTLASFERGISCTGRSSASLAGALLSRGGLCLLHGDLTTTILPAAPSTHYPLDLPVSAWSSLDSHLALAEGLLSPSTLVFCLPHLVSLPDFIHHCSRDVEVFRVAQVVDRV